MHVELKSDRGHIFMSVLDTAFAETPNYTTTRQMAGFCL